MKKATSLLLSFTLIGVLAFCLSSCKKDDPAPLPTASIFSSVEGYQVAFTATATDATSYAWDFGDSETSTEQNPTHVYALSGTYTVTLTVTGPGGSADATASVTIAASEMEMLTGGPAMPNGKSWVLSSIAGEGDGIYYAEADLGLQDPLVDGMLALIGLPGSEYQDEFTFKYDGTYTHDVVNDSVITDVIFAMVNQIPFRTSYEDVVVLCPFTPAASTFTYMEDEGLTLEVTNDDTPEVTESVTWSGVTVLEIAGTTEFVGIMDFTRKYVVFSIAVDKMQLGIFISATEGSKMMYPSHMLKMTFVPK
jgi:PKD repeat protein